MNEQQVKDKIAKERKVFVIYICAFFLIISITLYARYKNDTHNNSTFIEWIDNVQ